MERSWICLPLASVLLLCISTGCIPVAYVCPDIDVFSADLRDVSHTDHAKTDADDARGVITVEQTTKYVTSSPLLRFSERQRIRLLEMDVETVRHLSCGLAARCEVLSALSYGYHRTYESQLKAYRRGYQTLTILPWKPLKHSDWQPVSTLEEQEIAIDLLVDFRAELLEPVPAPKPTEDDDADLRLLRSIATTVDADTSLLLAEEYAWLAALATRSPLYGPHSAEIAPIHERLRLKSQYWQERDASSPIVRPWESPYEAPEPIAHSVPPHQAFLPLPTSTPPLGSDIGPGFYLPPPGIPASYPGY